LNVSISRPTVDGDAGRLPDEDVDEGDDSRGGPTTVGLDDGNVKNERDGGSNLVGSAGDVTGMDVEGDTEDVLDDTDEVIETSGAEEEYVESDTEDIVDETEEVMEGTDVVEGDTGDVMDDTEEVTEGSDVEGTDEADEGDEERVEEAVEKVDDEDVVVDEGVDDFDDDDFRKASWQKKEAP